MDVEADRSRATLVLGVAIALIVCGCLLGVRSTAFAAVPPVLAAAGDIACNAAENSAASPGDCGQGATSDLLRSIAPTAVATLGDNQYDSATAAEFMGTGAYNDTWGRLKPTTRPVAGNHEYAQQLTPINENARGYYGYFGGAAGTVGSLLVPDRGYYSYEVGSWHVVALDSNCGDDGCFSRSAGSGVVSSAEVSWLNGDLAAHRGQCTLAYWHHPRFTYGAEQPSAGTQPLWDALYGAGADVILNGHDHLYERYKQIDSSGSPVAVNSAGTAVAGTKGIRAFVVGTGGRDHSGWANPAQPRLDFGNDSDFGVLFLTLSPSGYTTQWRATSGAVLDSSAPTQCHQPQPVISSPRSVPVNQTAHFTANGVTPDANAIATWSWDFGDGAGTSPQQNPGHAYANPGTYTVTLTETDARGLTATRSSVVSVSSVAGAPAITSPADHSFNNTAKITLTGTAEPNSTITISDGGGPQATTSANSTGGWLTTLIGVPDGAHAYSATAAKVPSNPSPASNIVHVTVDTVPPLTTITSGPSGATDQTSASLAFSSDEAGSTFQCKLAGPGQPGAFSACSSPAEYAALSDGSYTFTVEATDQAGNTETNPPSNNFTVDTHSPPTRPPSTSPPLIGTYPGAPSGSVGPGPSTTPGPAIAAVPIPLVALLGGPSVSGSTATLTLACRGASGQACSGIARLISHERLHGSKLLAVSSRRRKLKPATKTVTDAAAGYTVAAGSSAEIKLTLNLAALNLLKRFNRLPATLTVNGKPTSRVAFRTKRKPRQRRH